MDRGPKVTLGRITKAQGLRGEVRVDLLCSPEVFGQLQRVQAVRRGLPERCLSVESSRDHGRFVVVKFAEVRDRSEAEGLVGSDLQVVEAEMPELPPGDYYTYELEGLEVVTESGETLGILEEVLDLPAHDVYVVRKEGREVMLPATEEVVRKVDLENGRMVVRLIEGLLD